MYTDILSTVIKNVYTTPFIKLKCGIRWGCPLSTLIFVLAVETLALVIKSKNNVKGLKIEVHEMSTQLAYDTTLILQDINALCTELNILYLFQKTSSLKLNYTKQKYSS